MSAGAPVPSGLVVSIGGMERGKPIWTSASFLVYAGGLVVLGAALGAIGYLAGSNGKAAIAGWSFLILAVLYVVAHGFRIRGRWVAAGIFAFASVIAWAVFVGALWVWFGWLGTSDLADSPLHGLSIARLSLELLILAAVVDDSRRFRFPLITSIGVFVGWLFVADLLSGGGSWTAVVTLLVGLVYLMVGSAKDNPSAFWFHLGAAVLIGGSLLFWWHGGDWQWALIAVAALVYVMIARATTRSSWAVLGAIGLLGATTHFAESWSHRGSAQFSDSSAPGSLIQVGEFGVRGWVPPLVFAFTGFLLVALGLVTRRRERF
jgi:hypothetical protein